MRDALQRQYNMIVSVNMVFLFLIISFLVYFNPFGQFTSNGYTSITIQTYHMNIMIALTSLVIISNVMILRRYTKHKISRKR